MKRFVDILHDILGHALLIMAVPVAAFYILEICNPSMHFMTNGFMLCFIAVFAILYVVRFVLEMIKNGKKRD